MIVTPIDTSAYPQCIAPVPSDTLARSPGVHLTTVIRDMAKTAGIGKDSGFDEEDLDWFAAGGHMWERIWDRVHQESIDKGLYVSPGEFICDGIACTPDRIDLTRPAIIETKCRWKSATKFSNLEKEFWAELMQVKSYCYVTGINEADLVVFFIAGDWRPPIPCVRASNLVFSDLELQESWSQIVAHAKWRKWL